MADLSITVRVTAHDVADTFEAHEIWASFLAEVETIAQRHELSLVTRGDWTEA